MSWYEKYIKEIYFTLFSRKNNIDDLCEKNFKQIEQDIEALERDYILGISETEYIDHLVEKYKFDTPIIDWDNADSDWEEEKSGNKWKYVMIYRFPFTGNFQFLEYSPTALNIEDQFDFLFDEIDTVEASPFPTKFLKKPPEEQEMDAYVKQVKYREERSWSHQTNISREEFNEIINEPHYINFQPERVKEAKEALKDIDMFYPSIYVEIVSPDGNGKKAQSQGKRVLNKIKSNHKSLIQKIEKYNLNVVAHVSKTFLDRKKRIIQNDKTLRIIGLPRRSRDTLPLTYNIPNPEMRTRISLKPPIFEGKYVSEPTLDDKVYKDILDTINWVGRAFEQLPSTYSNRQEQDLRDLFLLSLVPRYEGSATGETFNAGGRADILIRYENSNVFIAECKFWDGSKKYLGTITQLLKYLTWRDSKAAIMIFARTRSITTVLDIIKEATPQHPNFLGVVQEKREGWFDYRFHINGDRNKEVKLAVLTFHFPPKQDQNLQVIEGEE